MCEISRTPPIRILSVVLAGLLTTFSLGVVHYQPRGLWPDGWPKELEPFRDSARTHGVAHGAQETVYEIPFRSRRDFEKVWPAILKVKSRGAPIRLFSCYDKFTMSSSAGLENKGPCVRIIAPAFGSEALRTVGVTAGAESEWPTSAKSAADQLPEYVDREEDGTWVPLDKVTNRGLFKHRARIDIELVADGKVIDPKRIRLPANTPIIDERQSLGVLQSLQNRPLRSVILVLVIGAGLLGGLRLLRLARKGRPAS